MEPLILISATPSPFARMNRIALSLKSIPFTLRNEIPWESTTETPKYNPLEKLPVLLFPDSRPPVYDSAHIQEYIVRKYDHLLPRLITGDVDQDLEIRQIVVLSEGCLDAIVLNRWEGRRDEDKQSKLWMDRQNRKIDGALRAFNDMVVERVDQGKEYLVGEELTIADIAAVCTVGWIAWAGIRQGWEAKYPVLAKWVEKLDARQEFRETRPVMFDLTETVV
jgi:glutathione S-transferase